LAKDEFRKLPPKQLADDLEVYNNLKGMTAYTPANPAFTTTAITALHTTMESRREKKAQTAAADDAARDDLVAAEWAFHNGILGVKGQGLAQFGPDSNEVTALGLKKKSERKRPTRKVPTKT